MPNEENLKRYGKEKKPPTSEQARIAGIKGGKASAAKRAEAKTAKEILSTLNLLPASGNNKDALTMLGMPENMQTQKAMRIVALHKKALSGDALANKLLLEIEGDAPTPTVNIELGDETKKAYDKAAEAIKGTVG